MREMRSGHVTIESSKSMRLQQVDVSGYAPRPIYIEKPEMLAADNVSTTSFTAHWVGQEDAEYYYVTLFSMRDEKHVDVESFDAFADRLEIKNAGWSSNFVRTTKVVSESKSAVLFNVSGEQLVSKEYVMAPNQIRFWLSNNYVAIGNERVGGKLLLEGRNVDGNWKEIALLRISNTTKNLVKTYDLSAEEGMVQFRFTYTHDGGSGGTALDGWETHMDKTIQYVYKGNDLEIPAGTTSAIFNHLQSNTTYYYAVQAYEHKSCEGNYSPLSKLQSVKTWSADDVAYSLKVQRSENGGYVVMFPEPADGMSKLYVYSADGQLVHILDIPYSTTELILPTFSTKALYLLKQVHSEMSEKQATGKLVTF